MRSIAIFGFIGQELFELSFNTASGMRSIAIKIIHHGILLLACFNTASGMRSIAIFQLINKSIENNKFQYRKRYEVYCNMAAEVARKEAAAAFQYRKRYEVYCNLGSIRLTTRYNWVSIPQAV